MNRQRNVLDRGGHFDGEDALGDEFAGAGTRDADAENPLCLRVRDDLGDTVVPVERGGAAGCGRGAQNVTSRSASCNRRGGWQGFSVRSPAGP